MEFLHYSSHLLTKIEDREYLKKQDEDVKPYGFWFTPEIENNWKDWCKSENFSLESLNYKYQLEIDLTNILKLETFEQILEFSKRFKNRHTLDWKKVSSLYSGILITPYIWKARNTFETNWYYTWDCASGCVWDISVIKDFSLIEEGENVLYE